MTLPNAETTKSPHVASALSAFLPGAGQIYAARTTRGACILVGTIALTPVYVGLAIWLWQVFDAATCARDAQGPRAAD